MQSNSLQFQCHVCHAQLGRRSSLLHHIKTIHRIPGHSIPAETLHTEKHPLVQCIYCKRTMGLNNRAASSRYSFFNTRKCSGLLFNRGEMGVSEAPANMQGCKEEPTNAAGGNGPRVHQRSISIPIFPQAEKHRCLHSRVTSDNSVVQPGNCWREKGV